MVDTELRQLIEQGYVGPTLRCSHDPYALPMPDAQGGIPTIMMEMLAYSRPGVIEVLPALPPSLVKGSINGMLLRTFARLDKLTWDMDSPDRGPDGYLGEKTGRHVDCPVWHRRSFRRVRCFGGESPARQERLRPPLAGRKAGGNPPEAWPAQSAGLGELGRLITRQLNQRRDNCHGKQNCEPILDTAGGTFRFHLGRRC